MRHIVIFSERYWNHKITSGHDALSKKHQAEICTPLCTLPYAEMQGGCEALQEKFFHRYLRFAPEAVERLAGDGERLVTFFPFPREYWPNSRTNNVTESPLATMRLGTTTTKRFQKV